MEINKNLFVYAFLITLILFLSMLFLSRYMDDKRQAYIDENVQLMYNKFNEMQVFLLMSETYGDEMACLAFDKKLKELDKSVWSLGQKIDEYQRATEEFQKDPYYLNQKRVFNENEVFYLMLLTKLKEKCGINKAIISYFYKNSKECGKCDSQSFVLADIHNELKDEVSIFNFDADLDSKTIELLKEYYKIDSYPCLVVNENKFCGFKDKKEVINLICNSTNISAC